jgi:hypothetical protein
MSVFKSAGAVFGLGLGLLAADVANAAPPVTILIPYNADIVREVGGTTTNGLSLDGAAFVTQSFAAANDANDPHGLPDNGLFTAGSTSLQLGPYNGNNALRLAAQQTSGPIDVPDAQYTSLDVYVVAGDGFEQVFQPGVGGVTTVSTADVGLQIFLGHVGEPTGIASEPVPNFAVDPVGAEYLTDGLDTTGAAGAGFTDRDDAAIYRIRFDLGGMLLAPLGGLRFFNSSFANGQGVQAGPLYILGATLDTAAVPEPTTLLPLTLLGAGAMLRRRGRVRRA